MPMISYAQNREDVLLDRLFPRGKAGFYVDVGANHPVNHSVTKHFYEHGWRGINVEPAATVFRMLEADRPRDLNVNLGISDRDGALVFHEATSSLGMSTFDTAFAEGLVRDGFPCVPRSVPVTTLSRLFERYAVGAIDFLKIDVESHESEVLRGADFSRWRPRVVLIEATDRPERWQDRLLSVGYQCGAFDGLNRYYVREEDRDLLPKLAAPVNCLDDYITFEHHQTLADLQWLRGESQAQQAAAAEALREARARCEALAARLGTIGDLGPTSLAIARRLRAISRRIPGLSAGVRRFARRAG